MPKIPKKAKPKECTKCRIVKNPGQYYRRKDTHDGLASACIICTNIKTKETYESGTPEEKQARTDARIAANKKYLKNNPDKKAQYQRARKMKSLETLRRLEELEQRLATLEAKYDENDT